VLAMLSSTCPPDQASFAAPRSAAQLFASLVLGDERRRLPLTPRVVPPVGESMRLLVERRSNRVPLQHLTGWATLGDITVNVGAGVFVPRPETELLLEWGLKLLKGREYPVVVDLCTGSGALALAVAHARPDAVVYAVDNDATALAWARHNADARAAAGDTPIRLYSGDVTDHTVFAELDGLVDLVLCNPPYVPEGTQVPREVADHDPPQAVFAPGGGLAVIRHIV